MIPCLEVTNNSLAAVQEKSVKTAKESQESKASGHLVQVVQGHK